MRYVYSAEADVAGRSKTPRSSRTKFELLKP
jgi:hypothetical protein